MKTVQLPWNLCKSETDNDLSLIITDRIFQITHCKVNRSIKCNLANISNGAKYLQFSWNAFRILIIMTDLIRTSVEDPTKRICFWEGQCKHLGRIGKYMIFIILVKATIWHSVATQNSDRSWWQHKTVIQKSFASNTARCLNQ